ncbi:MAG TPA: molybdopterin cofactor-binding domain-containing protein [Spirochaetia bacterium]|nr:molybdopterin cofactor-binding domain-containing protein [Spirochaetia bacterium]
MHRKFSEVTRSRSKIDGIGLVVGRPAYADDLAPQEALVVRILRSPHAHARILAIDATEALKVSGVECVLSHADVRRIPYTRAGQGHPEPSPHDKFIFDEYVRYVGDEVALVAACDDATARAAMNLIKVEYEVLDAVLDFEQAIDSTVVLHPEPEIHDMFPIGFEPKRNIAAAYNMEIGDIEKTLKASDVTVESTYFTQAQTHVALEPHTAFTFLDLHGRLNVVTSTQNPFHTRRLLGQALEMPLRNIRVQKPRIGGGFGAKQHVHVEPYAALVTLKTGKPAKVVMTRREVFEASFSRHQMRLDIRLGAHKDGRIRAIDMQVLSNTGAYGEHALTVFMVGGSKTLPLYNKIESARFGGSIVYTNKIPAGAFRGYGAIQGNFALESAIDELAHKLDMDPIELRRKNMIAEGETSEVFRIMGEGGEGVEMVVESCKLDYCVTRGRELIGWDPAKLAREVAPGRVRAKGMAIAMQGSGIPLIDMGSANLELQDGGFFKLHIGATDLGTGSDTILAQIAAEELGVGSDDIIVYASDTDHTPYDVGAYASSTTYVSGNAVIEAARRMRQALCEAVADKFELRPDEVAFDGKTFTAVDGKKLVGLKEFSADTLYHNAAKMKTIATSGSYTGEKSPPPYMAGFVEIELDVETGKIDVIDFAAVVDCGTTINANLARIQVEGGLLQGIGMALYEDVQYSAAGSMLTNDMMQYKIPSRQDVGRLTVEFAQSYEPSGPFGAKSVGEIGIDTPLAAIANALYNATGARVRELPLTPPRVLAAIRKAGQKES